MLPKQKETILARLKSDENNKNYQNRYWFPYKDFLDPVDDFTTFSCENLDGKEGYLALIENLYRKDEIAKVFVEVYGYEENHDEQLIYADTLIIFSRLSLPEIGQIFNEPEDIFPSDIGEETDFSRPTFIINESGDFVPIVPNDSFFDGFSVYYCWWD